MAFLRDHGLDRPEIPVKIDDVQDFGKRMTGWWNFLQPDWRRTDAGVLPTKKSAPEGETWSALRAGGPHGLFLLLVGMAWWRNAVDPGALQQRIALQRFFWDVEYVLTEMVKVPVETKKRKDAPSSDTATRAKRTKTAA